MEAFAARGHDEALETNAPQLLANLARGIDHLRHLRSNLFHDGRSVSR